MSTLYSCLDDEDEQTQKFVSVPKQFFLERVCSLVLDDRGENQYA